MRKERVEHTLQPTALVNEAFFRLFNGQEVPFENTQQFFAASVRNMRLVLIDHARKTLAVKRIAADHPISDMSLTSEELLDIGLALDELAAHEPDVARIVELKFYGGLSIEEIAAVLESSPRSVVRTWTWARAWLYRRLRGAK
jgi:RNA polymerase sigma factor (TIGR02999 family)